MRHDLRVVNMKRNEERIHWERTYCEMRKKPIKDKTKKMIRKHISKYELKESQKI